MLDLYDEFAALIGALETAGAENAVRGGLAMAIHGFPRATIDVDLVVPPSAAERVLACARDLAVFAENVRRFSSTRGHREPD